MISTNTMAANSKSIKASLKKFYGVSAIRCSTINGKMFLNVNLKDKETVDNFLREYGFCHSSGSNFISTKNGINLEYPNLVINV